MKSLLALFCAAAALTAFSAPQANIYVELDGRHCQLELKETKGEGFKFSNLPEGKNKDFYHRATSIAAPGAEWKDYTISFIPTKHSIIFGLGSTSSNPKVNSWIDYDAVKIDGAALYNGSFEIINSAKEADGWRYYSPDCVRVNKKDAPDGKNYFTANSNLMTRCGLRVVPGKKITITFKARAGKPVKIPAQRYYSSGKRQVK